MITVLFLLLIGIFIYSWFIEPAFLEIKNELVVVNNQYLHAPLRILFISDLHLGVFNSTFLLQKKISKLREGHKNEPYDLILMGGDYLDRQASYLPNLIEIIKSLAKWDVPLYGVLGNHDMSCFSKSEALVRVLHSSGLKILDNQAEIVTIDHQKIVIIGLRDLEELPGYSKNTKDHSAAHYKQVVAKSDWYSQFDLFHPELPRVVIGHNPDTVYLKGINPQLNLSGHTHGGQILFLKWWGHFVKGMMPRGSFVAWSGRRIINNRLLIVSKGLSGSLFPARFLSKPDVISITMSPLITPQNVVIGLSGKPRSGKDTVSDMFEALFPGITRLTFGSAIKAEYDVIHGTDTLHNHEVKFAHRDALNEFGASKRAIDPQYWIKKTITTKPPLLITDVRQPQEVVAVHEAGGVMIRIEADLDTLRERAGDHAHLLESHVNHEQESHLDEFGQWDYVVHNNGSLEDLEKQIRKIAREIHDRYKL